MNLPFSNPDPIGTERAEGAKTFRDLATEIARLRPHALTRANGEEADLGATHPANFTKGLKHDAHGLLAHADDYRRFVEAVNAPDPNLFESSVRGAADHEAGYEAPHDEHEEEKAHAKPSVFRCEKKDPHAPEKKAEPSWRGWESPRAGHVYELEGADSGALGMAPAPRVGSSELAAEMAEVYALAILRDVPFSEICAGGGQRLCGKAKDAGFAKLSAAEIVELLNGMPFYSGAGVRSSTPLCADASGLNAFERRRRAARLIGTAGGPVTAETVFRGSTPGAQTGPYVSQFMLIGGGSRAGAGGAGSAFPGLGAKFDPEDGFIGYGAQVVDQRSLTHKNCLDHMTDWASWLDVQNGANFGGCDLWEHERRFITTPRDLATYVHFDSLYQAYLNACLLLLGMEAPVSKGFPEPSPSGRRTPFATFGGPHILTLVAEVATRCLKAVRRQKFNHHRRARPEAVAGRLTLAAAAAKGGFELEAKVGPAAKAFERTFAELPAALRDAIAEHNAMQNTDDMQAMRLVHCDDPHGPKDLGGANLLLPMAFPEGSPMHPAYGAGHATVAGGCVTMLKAFFEMFEACDAGVERELRLDKKGKLDPKGAPVVYEPDPTGAALVESDKAEALTIQGELDKLAANISIGRNMAGVHYYSDYYDSLRMGERVAVAILMEQAPTYGDAVEVTFKSFDGDFIAVSGEAGAAPSLTVIGRDGAPVAPDRWWLRHASGGEAVLDL